MQRKTCAFVLLLALSTWAQAQGSAQQLSQCLADNTSGRDRKDLAKWIVLAMESHPEIKKFASNEALAAADDVNRNVASLFTRLLTGSCLKETQATMRDNGAAGIQVGFQTLGQLAMQELMSDPAVAKSMGAFDKYVDKARLNQVLTQP